jgi:GDP-mannose 6-dehydrogenase
VNISIFGLGYVGGVTAACLANDGHLVVGVDVQTAKVDAFNAGLSPIVEPCLDDLLRAANAKARLKATTSAAAAIAETELSIVCVGTPSKVTGALDLSFVREVVREIGEAVRTKGQKHTLVLRSTMLPGSTQDIVRELLSDLTASSLLAVYYYPEFLREGTGVADFQHPSLTVVGTSDGGEPPQALKDTLFGPEAMVVDWPTAEMVKYACNAFHATKIAFANEMGRIGKQMGLDARAVMDLLCRDTKLNLSSYYLRPGNPFGGSCLPKDVRALTQEARTQGLSLPLLENLLPSNERHLQTLLGIITDSGQKEICLLGLAFKSNTDDLREAPMVEVAQILLGRGFTIRIYDPALNLSALVGANKRLIDTRMPHLAALLRTDLKSALGHEGMVIAAQKCASLSELKQHLTVKHHVLDINGWPELASLPSRYEGLCW